MRYPRFVTRQSLAAIITLLLLAFLAVALIFPWHLESIEISNSNSGANANGRIIRQWTWKGAYMQVTTKDRDSRIKSLFPQRGIVEWNDVGKESKHARSTYITSQVFVILALAFAISLFFFLFLGLIVRSTATSCARLLRGNAKWLAFTLALSAFTLALLAWTLFFRFPSALRRDDLCPAAVVGPGLASQSLWCADRSIAGSRVLHAVPWAVGNDTGVADFHITWAPSVGWFFCVFSSALMLPILVFTGCVRSPQDEERLTWHYRVLGRGDSVGSIGELV